MDYKVRIYCIEGVHDWGEGEVEPTVEPMLELFQRLGYWDYVHRTCSSYDELEYRLENEWYHGCKKGSVLYFCTHGASDQIWLRSEQKPVGVLTLKDWLGEGGCEGCHIHFGGCETFKGGPDNLQNLMDYTGATSVSGYATLSYWVGRIAPALVLELQLFGLLKDEVNIARNTKGRPYKLRRIRDNIQKRFDDCKFNMLVRPYKKS